MNPDTAYAVLLTDREKLGAAIRLLAEDGTPTLRPGRARLFKHEQAAKAWLTRNYVDPRVCSFADRRFIDPRYLYTVAEVVVPPRRSKPARPSPPLLPLVWEAVILCVRCNRSRPPDVHPCPRCQCPGYRIEGP